MDTVIYFLKVIIGYTAFYLFYYCVLQRVKMLVFNRFYLLLTMVIPFIIPFVKHQVSVPTDVVAVNNYVPNITYNALPIANSTVATLNNGDFYYIILGIVLMISLFFLTRFVRNLRKIYSCIRQHEQVKLPMGKIILLPYEIPPHSFLNNIFFDKNAYQGGKIDDMILAHELAHVRQKHSWDILFVELMQVVFWFNPLLGLYKRAIKLNHEFLADATAVRQGADAIAYQQILLQTIQGRGSYNIASNFNFLITKKRILMIQKTFNKKISLLLGLTAIPLLVTMILAIGKKVYASPEPAHYAAQTAVIDTVPQPTPSQKEKNLPDDVESLTIVTPSGIPYAVLKYKNGKTVKEDIRGSKKEAFEKKYGIEIPPPPPPPPPPPSSVKAMQLPKNVQSLEVVTKNNIPYGIIKYKNGKKIMEDISGSKKEAFEKKYGVQLPPPPPPPPTPPTKIVMDKEVRSAPTPKTVVDDEVWTIGSPKNANNGL